MAASAQAETVAGMERRVRNVAREAADEYIGRGSPYGNPFVMHDRSDSERQRVIRAFREWLPDQPALLRLIRRTLPGQTLGCHCAPEACHGDVLVEIADGEWDDWIPPEPVFVFGSNEAGRHGKGAARLARDHYGAVNGKGEGSMGQAYAIPTKDADLNTRPLSAIQESVERFLEHARQTPDQRFAVTRVGCGLAGYADVDVAPMFAQAPDNVELPAAWRHWILGSGEPIRVAVGGDLNLKRYEAVQSKLSTILRQQPNARLITSGDRGASMLAERFAVEVAHPLTRIPVEWDRFEHADRVRDLAIMREATHAVVFDSGEAGKAQAWAKTAREAGLRVRTVSV
ncbi:DUF4326 domain-containing protein [Thioalkalivibrio sp. ALE19]|uniref:A1S_2505 family phage non-structural protein n=1 Tax=Thioalkalivibrio sp. ALE19 TaxID=1266909 RepID=UPI0003F5DA9F|nr:DUF4326 domain-containing protein [Thioalkalivibrio sp. ALE19]